MAKIYVVRKYFYFYFFLCIHLIILKKYRSFQKKKYLALIILIINQHFKIISKRSCDTEEWSNDAENSALITRINYILQYIKTQTIIYIVITFFKIFDQINAAFMSRRDFFKKSH